MARWKARVKFLLSAIEVLFYLLRLRRYNAKCVTTRCIKEGVGHLEPRFQGEGVVPGEYFLVSTHFAIQQCKLHRATCRRFDAIPACAGQTELL